MTRQHDDGAVELELQPTAEELEAATALREALEGHGDHPDAELARALRCAVNPPELSQLEHQAIIHQALRKLPNRKRAMTTAVVSAGTALALAAAIALLVSKTLLESPSQLDARGMTATASLVRSRSTQPLFDEPFPVQGGESARIDKIAGARQRDYRSNLFERMGVR